MVARPDTARYRLRKFVRRNRTAVALAATTAVALVSATAFSVAQMQKAKAQEQEALRAAQRANALAELQTVFAGDSRDPDGQLLTPAGRVAMAEGIAVRRFQREPWLDLCGEWAFEFDASERGWQDGWYLPGRRVFDRRIQVPFSWAAPLSGIAQAVWRHVACWKLRVDQPNSFHFGCWTTGPVALSCAATGASPRATPEARSA